MVVLMLHNCLCGTATAHVPAPAGSAVQLPAQKLQQLLLLLLLLRVYCEPHAAEMTDVPLPAIHSVCLEAVCQQCTSVAFALPAERLLLPLRLML
jgi:hypothetical protein